MNMQETVALLTTEPTDDEMEQWFNEAAKGYEKAKMMDKIGMTPYEPAHERVLRLLYVLRNERGQVLIDPNVLASAMAQSSKRPRA